MKVGRLDHHYSQYVSYGANRKTHLFLQLATLIFLGLQETNFEAGLVVPESATEPTSMKYQPLSSTLFTGREDFLSELEEFFTDQGPGQHLRREYLLHGMGGAGKTQIALKFAEQHRQRQAYVDFNFLICG